MLTENFELSKCEMIRDEFCDIAINNYVEGICDIDGLFAMLKDFEDDEKYCECAGIKLGIENIRFAISVYLAQQDKNKINKIKIE